MAKACPICNKGTLMVGKRNLLRGEHNPTKKKRKYPNLQWATLLSGKRIKICTSCMKKDLHIKRKIEA